MNRLRRAAAACAAAVVGAAMLAACHVPLGAVSVVIAGGNHTCALHTDGSVECWGRNAQGQLGDGSDTASQNPVGAAGVFDAISIAAGGDVSCAVLAGGTLQCWGSNQFGQLGGSTPEPFSAVPLTIPGLSGVTQVSVAPFHVCAALEDGSARCWGRTDFGQLGDGTVGAPFSFQSSPFAVSGLGDVISVSAGSWHTCALRSGGTVSCWGRNWQGALGTGDLVDSPVPIPVPALLGVAQVTAGSDDTCVLLTDGTVRCWGYNAFGQLGDGTTTRSASPVPV
ncbi:MAG TPA: hypothetical protein PK748_02040, partial [Acidimicrobiales bacterium]|nr:hypothetical protein [Acidimicrobiales bacterium]